MKKPCTVDGCTKPVVAKGLCSGHYQRLRNHGDPGVALTLSEKFAGVSEFGLWTVLSRDGRRWLCRCSCGTERLVNAADLCRGKSESCGCYSEKQRQRISAANTKHGMSARTEFQIWTDMKRRCHDPRREDYKNYGARGITVCDEWRTSFEAFYRDMGPRPEGHTLDRLQNAGPYSKANCVWAPRKAQERNKRTNRIVEVNGRRMTLAEAAEVAGADYYAVHRKLRKGLPIDQALAESVRPRARS